MLQPHKRKIAIFVVHIFKVSDEKRNFQKKKKIIKKLLYNIKMLKKKVIVVQYREQRTLE